ncbi:hypothetical protein [Rhodalgimonas zhirmunskyi]|uniref:Uncharacterized protein n=1 Tax=Rhodalgimonas zhirmunskyi TaxID=2964767 RepID=A0AAJ1X602_9RHOB|nr:hypothetical protein [Rhodoalgimonas zhirmunskyi]MDQ2092917.1 hypothetical protein [Rhodoalgimonas zhirmunskyi]
MASSKPYPPKPATPAPAGTARKPAPSAAPSATRGKPAPIITDYASL